MSNKNNDHEWIECRLVIIEAQSMQILATVNSACPLLLRESIPVHARVAESLNQVIERRYGISTIQLAFLREDADSRYCAVHEIIDVQQALPTTLLFASLDEIARSELADEERAMVRRIMTGEASELGRFARIGWIDELLSKTGHYLAQSARPLIRQVNLGIDFCLLSLTDTTGHKVWFKAVGEPNTREYALTIELAGRFPAFLPSIIFPIPEWSAWVMEDVKGIPLSDSGDLHQSEQALTALATMQIELSSEVSSLLSLGAEDWSCTRIASLSGSFFEEAHRAMLAQVSQKSRPLDLSELNQLQKDVEDALCRFMRSGIPETLLHGDIGHGNILSTNNGPIFLDWAEAYVGHPFLSAEHLLADLSRSSRLFAQQESSLRSHYAAHWRAYAQCGVLSRVTQFAAAIAAFAYAVIAWNKCSSLPDSTTAWPFLRSMLRRTRWEFDRTREVVA